MHYADGQEVKLGDLALCSPPYDGPTNDHIGIVVSGTPAQSSCNIQLSIIAQRTRSPLGASEWRPAAQPYPVCVNTSECLRLDTPAKISPPPKPVEVREAPVVEAAPPEIGHQG